MKIAVDCRYIGKSGIGRVCEGLLGAFDYSKHEFYLIGKKKYLEKYTGAHIVEDETDPYSFAGLRSFNKKLNKICDALVIPNFLVPFGVKIPVHSVMHDLAFLDIAETTRGFVDRKIKKILLKRCMKKSKTVACVSEFTLHRCEFYYKKLAEKCYVNYNGMAESVLRYAEKHAAPAEKGNYIVFVGNVKPHKGLTTLLAAFLSRNDGSTLKIIGQKENFLTGLQFDEDAFKNVIFTGQIDDEALFSEIQHARYLVLPSRYEGFGLPPLEALILGTQPIVSDIPVFREVYADLPVKFFESESDLAHMLGETEEVPAGTAQIVKDKYSYKNAAEKLLSKIAR